MSLTICLFLSVSVFPQVLCVCVLPAGFQDYMQNVHGKEIDLLRTTVKVPGKRPPRAVSTCAAVPSPKTNGLAKELSSMQLGQAPGETHTHTPTHMDGHRRTHTHRYTSKRTDTLTRHIYTDPANIQAQIHSYEDVQAHTILRHAYPNTHTHYTPLTKLMNYQKKPFPLH